MTSLLSFPVRLSPDGSFVTRDDSEDGYFAEELAQLVQVRPGERELVPTYGINDPAFSRFDSAMLAAQVATFGPPVRINRLSIRQISDTRQDVTIEFDPAPNAGGGGRLSYADSISDTFGDPTYEELNS